MGWTERPLLCVDIETTGTDWKRDDIVEVAVATLDPEGRVTASWSSVVYHDDIPEEASAIHGITTERAIAEGVGIDEVLRRVAGDLWAHQGIHVPDGAPVVAYKAEFDWPFLSRLAASLGVPFPVGAPILDPYLLDKYADRYRKGSRKLADVAAHYGVTLTGEAHGALVDCIAAGRIMQAIIRQYPKIGEHTLGSLNLLQIRAHETQRASFVDYKRSREDQSFDIPAGWPIPVAS